MDCFDTPFGNYLLRPLYHHPKSPIQAWNAADELVLMHLWEQNLEDAKIMVVNDAHGALMTSLHQYSPVSWNDSLNSKLACQGNHQHNHLNWQESNWINSNNPPKGQYDYILIKIPKSLAFLQYQLHWLRSCCHPNTAIVGAAMVKHLSSSMVDLFQKHIGNTETTLARKKARLVLSRLNANLETEAPAVVKYPLDGTHIQLHNHPNVFSQQKLDIGTRFLLQHFPKVNEDQVVIDLGCGNGALGCFAASRQPRAHILFCDDSHMALESAKSSWHANGFSNKAKFIASDALSQIDETADLILCNPPFHQGSQIENQTPLRMFSQASDKLNPGGQLLVVGNRHLNYHHILKRYFKQVQLVASNKKFVVLSAMESKNAKKW